MTIRHSLAMAFVVLAFAPPAQAGDPGVLRIVTEPGDAQIFIDGKRKGNSPSEAGQSFAIKLDEGSHVVEAVKPDGVEYEYVGRKDDVFVSDGTMQTQTLKLQRQQTAEGKRLAAERDAEKQRIAAAQEAENKRVAAEQAVKREAEVKKQVQNALARIRNDMVSLPAGSFRMGCDEKKGDENCGYNVRPVHAVTIKPFEMGKTEVTFDEWDACVADGGCPYTPQDKGWGRGNQPVINVSWNDTQTYLAWLNRKTGKSYRLPTEAEWEYAARAGTTTAYFWGNDLGGGNANCYGCGSRWGDKQTAPVGSFRPNPFGLYDMHGNVEEWVQDCWHDYEDAPQDGSAVMRDGSCFHVVRGGSWESNYLNVTSTSRDSTDINKRVSIVGFRLARSLP